MRSIFLVLLICASDYCLGRPQQQQLQMGHPDRPPSMVEMQAHGPQLEQHSQAYHEGRMPPMRVQHRDISVINEPSCDELKAMWRFSKRQARTPEIINEISTYKDPFSYNEWAPYYSTSNAGYVSSSRSAGGSGGSRFRTGTGRRPVFGRVVHKAPLSSAVSGFPFHGGRGYEQVARLYGALQGETTSRRPSHVLRLPGGGVPAQTGRFQHLKEIIQTERARELQQQRADEELAARAAALKEIAGGQRVRENYHHAHKHRDYGRTPWGSPQDLYSPSDDPSYYHTTKDRYTGDTGNERQGQEGLITYPTRRSGMWQVQRQFFNDRQGTFNQQQAIPQTEQSIMISRRSDPFFLPSSLDPVSNPDEYLAEPMIIEDPQMFMEPFLFNFHNNLDKTLLDDHMAKRSGGPHYIFN